MAVQQPICISHQLVLVLCCFLAVSSGTSTLTAYKDKAHDIAETTEEVCDTEVFEASCEDGHVIMMTAAVYGRMELGRCVEIDMGFLGCHADVMDVVDRKCSGRRSCRIPIPHTDLEQTRPCLKELKTYLQASYQCIPLVDVPYNRCRHIYELNTSAPQGWIASIQTTDYGCGTPDVPYVIHVEPGQRINVTLYDFSVERSYQNSYTVGDTSEVQVCNGYAVIQEAPEEWNSHVCGGHRRIQHVMLSKRNTIQIQITSNENKYFLLKYEAVGCGDLTPPSEGWFERRDDGSGVVGCLHDESRWQLLCDGSKWKGEYYNCTAPIMVTAAPTYGDISLPVGASVAIIICAALFVGVSVVIIGLCKFKRMKNTRHGETAHTMENIGLHEKPINSAQPGLPPELTECTLEATSPGQGGGGPGEGMGFCTTPRVIRHQRTVKINGNEYAHIWESPLPAASLPDGSNCCQLAGPGAGPSGGGGGGHMECTHYRTILRGEPGQGGAPVAKNAAILFKPPHGDCFHLYGTTTGHGSPPMLGPIDSPIRHTRPCPQAVLPCEGAAGRYASLESRENAINNSNSNLKL